VGNSEKGKENTSFLDILHNLMMWHVVLLDESSRVHGWVILQPQFYCDDVTVRCFEMEVGSPLSAESFERIFANLGFTESEVLYLVKSEENYELRF
jgi:hypothetical protein